jgi:hypothetical protein
MASNTVVLPVPFAPTNTVSPRPNSTSIDRWQRTLTKRICCSSTGFSGQPDASARVVRRTFPTEVDPACSSVYLDDIALRQLVSAVTFGPVVQSSSARLDEQLGFSAGAGKSTPLQELTQGDRTFDKNSLGLRVGVRGHTILASL